MSVLPFTRAIAAALVAASGLWAVSAAAQDRAPEPGIRVVDVAAVEAAQPGLLAGELDGIRPGVPGKTELFAVLAAWYPHQGVFLREVEAAGEILADRFGAGGRIVTLANSDMAPLRHPLATVGGLEAAISALAGKMNAGEDVLMVYLTSHGAPEVLAGGDWPLETPALDGGRLSLVLDQAGVANTVAVISACKSGSFLPLLAGPDRLVITAAAADRNSFGCSDANDWTWFGEAFFDNALRETRSLPNAFARAAALVAAWEEREDEIASRPQMAQGERIAGALERLARDAGG